LDNNIWYYSISHVWSHYDMMIVEMYKII